MTTPTPFTLTVSGSASNPVLAEQAIINVVVSNEGEDKAVVSSEVITAATQLEKILLQLSPQEQTPEAKAASPLAHWSKTSLSATSYVPTPTKYGSENPKRRFRSHVRFDIRFQEFKALGSFGEAISSMSFVEVDKIEWILLPATKRSLQSQLRKDAAKDAMQKAQDYCEVLGCTNLRPVELDDTLCNYEDYARGYSRTLQRGCNAPMQDANADEYDDDNDFSSTGSPQQPDESEAADLEFTPQEVQMSMEVTLKFHADPIRKS